MKETTKSIGSHWTDPQRAAIEHVHGDLVVSAAAGSGKTAVLAERCARLVCRPPAADGPRTGIENLLVLTFTEAAAAEMRTRIADAIQATLRAAPPREQAWLRRQVAMVDRASISTLHAFCARLLRQHFHEARVDPAFDILDEEEARLLQDEVFDQLLAQWHNLPATPPATPPTAPAGTPALTAAAFTDFFEAFAQGRQSSCRDLVLSLHRMLASTVNPDQYIAAACALYGGGAEKTLADYSAHTLAKHLSLARLEAQRALDEVRAIPDARPIADGLEKAVLALDDAASLLQTHGPGGWPTIATNLAYKWPTLRRIESLPDFDSLKDRTWDSVKKSLKDLAPLFTPDPPGMLRDLRDLARPLETLLALTDQFANAFSAAKLADNRLDFADLERRAHALLTQPQSLARAELQQRYHFLLVDEFQDINPLQEAILEAVRNPAATTGGGGGGRGNLFVVGDIKQSIYAFRLAQPDLFLTRERAARAAQTADTAPRSFVPLQHNFRSHPALLASMNRIFGKILTEDVVGIDYADGHELQPPPAQPESTAPGLTPARAPEAPPSGRLSLFAGAPIELHLVATDLDAEEDAADESPEFANTDDADSKPNAQENLSAVEHEARIVAQRITDLLAENRGIPDKHGALQPLRPRHIAILLRTMKNKALIFARALADRGIPVHADLSSGFFDTQEVKDTLALLQVLDNPQQDIPLATALLGPFGNFAHDDLAAIRLAFDRREVPFAQAVNSLADEDQRPPEALPSELVARLRAFFDTLRRWREQLRARPLHEGLAAIFAESKILAYVAGLDTGAQRVANLQLLHQRALQFSTFRKQGLHRFLRFIERLHDQETMGGGGGGGDIGEAPIFSEASDVVRILSVHKSKGLEFPVVFVSGLGGKLRLNSYGPVLLHSDLGVGLYVADIERNITYPSAAALRIAAAQRRQWRAEELRLLYVAMTRARSGLILTGHIHKNAELDAWRHAWQHHRGPLPEDLLLKGTRALDWLMPALAADLWTTPPAAAHPILFSLHVPETQSASPPASPTADAAARLDRILAAQPIAATSDPRVEGLIRRVTGTYAHEAAALQPAVQTVTFLKSLASAPEAAGETPETIHADLAALLPDADPTPPSSLIPQHSDDARLRGIATHRILELIDFTACAAPDALSAQIHRLLAAKLLTPDEAARADRAGIEWFLWQSSAGKRVLAAAHQIAADQAAGRATALHLRREIPFTWLGRPLPETPAQSAAPSLPLFDQMPSLRTPNSELRTSSSPSSPLITHHSSLITPSSSDLPTIRGIIDLLLANPAARRAEILDYKTDAPRLWQSRLDDYRRQMSYYLAAASDILGFPVQQATLLFLSPRREIPVFNV